MRMREGSMYCLQTWAMRGALRAVVFAVCTVLTLWAKTPQAPPTFKAEATYIEVDAFITDKDGAFVRGLAREDFELLEDGQPQEVATFSFVDVPVEPRSTRKEATVDPDTATNVGERRVYVMLIEPLDPNDVRKVRLTQNVALRFVDEALGSNDMMAVIHPQGSTSHAQAFTSSKTLLHASIEELPRSVFIAGSPSPCEPTRLRFTYETIERISERLGAVSGRRKAIIWIGGRIPFDPAA